MRNASQPHSMHTINRNSVTVRVRAPYLAWARIDAGADFPENQDPEATVYLLDETAAGDAHEALIAKHWKTIFEAELEAWDRDPSRWPGNRTRKMFREWFEVTVATVVFDLGKDPLEAD